MAKAKCFSTGTGRDFTVIQSGQTVNDSSC